MPYIKGSSRDHLAARNTEDISELCYSPGDLNYVITKICDDYLGKNPSYTHINEVIGVLECAKLEFYRRVAVPYEDKKIEENGDVYQTRV